MTNKEKTLFDEAVAVVRREIFGFHAATSLSEQNNAKLRLRIVRDHLQSLLEEQEAFLKEDKRAYKLANIGRIASMVLMPVGALMVVGAVLTGASGAGAEILSGAGIVAAGGGYVSQQFVCTQERKREAAHRIQERQESISIAKDALDEAATIV